MPRTALLRQLKKLYRQAFVDLHNSPSTQPESPSSTLSRKEFIGTTAMASAALLVPSLLQAGSSPTIDPAKRLSVAIIGGGIAGLNACRILSREPALDITLYEADKRMGGRMFTERNLFGNNLTTEKGGEFIDTDHKEMLDLVNAYGLELYNCAEDIKNNHLREHSYFFGGQMRPEDEVVDAFKKILPTIQKHKQKIETEDTAALEELDKLSLSSYLHSLGISGWFHELLYWAFTAEFGMDASVQSCLNFIEIIGIKTEEGFPIFGNSDECYKIIGGNDRLIQKMATEFASKIQLQHHLSSLSKEKDQLVLHFRNGKIKRADYVLLAIPFTTLRHITFGAGIHLPDNRKKMIDQLGYGTNSKLLLGFNERIWRTQGSSGYIMNETIQNGWDNSQLQNKNQGEAGFTIFLGGSKGHALADTPANRKTMIDQLEKIFPGSAKLYNGKHKAVNWSTNPYSSGSYACYKVGQWTKFDTNTMMEPISNIYFAGEHCSFEFQGFMNGGADTGRLAAENMIKAMQLAPAAQPA